ncbi:hypothetical protein GXP67_23865 [Rhodocytophaga rosea]|uniref:DUF308 domain-containing protein n=1 Tax=Rhodocytophaga rosea TaxID=2704465 RepID=A0A6C0GPF2_9BACT|nr:DUF308 domain-containing protein [Rhodocytophaga rosea]QHT69462.1 hypothetical protein GXP67_23865 [Rhodocytophaga rosea]
MITRLQLLNEIENKLIAVKGSLCAIFGLTCIISIFLDNRNFTFLAYTLGIFTLVSGLISLLTIAKEKISFRHFALFHYEGIASFILGMLILGFRQTAISIFMGILGGIAVGIGLMQIALAFDIHTFKIKEGVLIYSGILTVLLGAILFNNPDSISEFVSILLGVFFIVLGGYVGWSAWKHARLQKKSSVVAAESSAPVHAQVTLMPVKSPNQFSA